MSFWMDNAAMSLEKPKHILVDCGYVNHPAARENADRLMKHVSRTNVEIVAAGRILVRIPPSKKEKVLLMFPEITAGAGYCWTTHVFGDGEQFGVKHAWV